MAETAKITAVLEAEDRTKAGINSASGNMDKLGSVAKKLGTALVAAFAAREIIAFGKASFEAFGEAEAAMTRVETVLRTMGKAAEANLPKIQELSKAAVKLGFDDEAAAESITKFYQRTNDLTKAQELNALAMDLARAKSIDLSDATNMVNMVLSGNGKVLKQYGIDIKETATPLEALGQLHVAVGGQAEAFAQTTQGALQRLNIEFGNLQEAVGELLAKALLPMVQALSSFITAIPSIEGIQTALGDFFQMIDEKTGLVTLLKDAWDDIVLVYQQSLKPALEELWVALQPYMPFLKDLAYVFGTMLVIALGAFVMAMKGLIILLTEFLTMAAKVATFITNVLTAVFSGMQSAIEAVVGAVQRLIDALARLNVMQGLKSIGNAILPGTPFRAMGGGVGANQPYIVGERGPELFVPQGYGRITPNSALAGGGGITINITGNSFMGDDDMAEVVGDKIMRVLKRSIRI